MMLIWYQLGQGTDNYVLYLVFLLDYCFNASLLAFTTVAKGGSRVSSKSSRTQSEFMSHKKKSIKNFRSIFVSGKI